MSVILSQDELDLLRPGLDSVFTAHNIWNDQWKEIYSVHYSDKGTEYDVEMRPLGMAAFKAEQRSGVYGDMSEFAKTAYVMQTVQLGYMISWEAVQDNLYKSQFPQGNLALANSLRQFKNIQGANILNRAFDTNYPIADGQPLCSLTRPVANGTYANTLSTQAGLNETSLQDLLITLDQFKSPSGLKIHNKAKKIVAPSNLQFQATTLLNSKFQTNTANNNISAIVHSNNVPYGATINQFLNSSTNWFLLTDEVDAFKFFTREGVRTDMFTDIDTNVLKVRAFERYAFNVRTGRGVLGVQGY